MNRSIPNPLYDTQGRMHSSVRRSLHRANRIALLLDYDGTLTRIRSTPGEAVLSSRARNILQILAQKPNMTLSIVTGRSLKQIRSLLPSIPLDIAANHGLQISQPRRSWIHPSARSCIPLLTGFHRRLKQQLKAIPGILLENKHVVLTIHYRNVPGGQIAKIRATVKEALEPFVGRLRITTGKKVIEIRPAVVWTKGDAIMRLLAGRRRRKALPVFIGDDRTDEDGFQSLRMSGITIRVGRAKPTRARYSVSGVNGVLRFLEDIAGGIE